LSVSDNTAEYNVSQAKNKLSQNYLRWRYRHKKNYLGYRFRHEKSICVPLFFKTGQNRVCGWSFRRNAVANSLTLVAFSKRVWD